MIVLLYLISVLTVYSFIRLTRFIYYQYGLYQEVKHLPGPVIGNPFTGNLNIMMDIVGNRKGVAKRFYSTITDLCDKHGREHGFIRLWLGPFVPWFVVCDAKLARQILTSRFHTNKASYYRMMENFATGTSLFTTPALEARRQRRILKEHFTLRYLDLYVTKMEHHLDNLVARIDDCIDHQDGYYPDINNLVSTFIYDTVGDNLFSSTFTSIKTSIEPPYVAAIHEMITWLEIAILQPWRYLWSNRLVLLAMNTFNCMSFSFTLPAFKSIYRYHSAVYDIVRHRYDQLVGPVVKGQSSVNVELIDTSRPSLIDSLLLARVFNKTGQSKLAGFIDVMWHMDMFIVAGHDTSTASITWTLYMLAHHREAQNKAREEINKFLEELSANGEKPNQLNLKRLTYLECCIKETLRLYPVAPFLGRTGTQHFQVNDQYSIPAFTDITVFYDYAHTQEKYFPNAKQFLPERYERSTLSLDAEPVSANQTIFPFSLGERGCLGKQYAMAQMKLLFITLLSKYEIIPLDKVGDINEDHHFLTKPPNFPVKMLRLK